MIKISLIHPSRGRPEKAKSTYDYWMSMASGKVEIEHILSLDFSDTKNEEYGLVDGIYKPFGKNSRITIDHNTCVVEAANQAAKISTGDIICYLSDDFICPENWDEKITTAFKQRYLVNGGQSPLLLKVHDNLQPFNAEVLTIPIMNRELYNRIGYFFNPLYKSMWVDCDLYHVCNNNNWLVFAPEFVFEHLHYSVGKAPKDETYIRSDANWNQGKEVYAKRKLEGFKI